MPFDVNGITNMELSFGQLQNSDIYLGKIMSDFTDLFLHRGLLLIAYIKIIKIRRISQAISGSKNRASVNVENFSCDMLGQV